MARASGTRFVFDADALPALAGALDARGGRRRDRRRGPQPPLRRGSLDVDAGVAPGLVTLAHDPQTSGGLLAAIDPAQVAAVEAALDAAGVERWWIGPSRPTAAGGSVALG